MDSAAMRKLFAGSHIKALCKFVVRSTYLLRLALVEKVYLPAHKDTVVLGCTRTVFEVMTQRPMAGSTNVEISVDLECRPTTITFDAEATLVAAHFEKEMYALVGAAEPSTLGCDSMTSWFGNTKLDERCEELGIGHELEWTKRLPAKSSTERSALQHAKDAGVCMDGVSTDVDITLKLQEYLLGGLAALPAGAQRVAATQCTVVSPFRFANAAAHEAGLRAADKLVPTGSTRGKVSAVPDGANVNLKVLLDLIFKVMPPFLLLELFTRVRTKHLRTTIRARLRRPCERCAANHVPQPGCRCASAHPWLAAVIHSCESAYMRRQKNYQRALVYFCLWVGGVLRHANPLFVELVLLHCVCAMSSSLHGDSWLCSAVDLQQEGEVISVVKEAIRRCITAVRACIARARYLSYQRMLRVLAVSLLCGLGRRSPETRRARQLAEDQTKRMYGVATVIVQQVVESGANLDVAGEAGTPLRRPELLFVLPSLARNHAKVSLHAFNQAVKEKLDCSSVPWRQSTPITIDMRKASGPGASTASAEAKQQRGHDRRKLLRDLAAMVACGQLQLPDLWSAGKLLCIQNKLGHKKADLVWAIIQRYSHTPEDELGHIPVPVFRTAADMHAFLEPSATRTFTKVVDGMALLQRDPNTDGPASTLKMIARAVIRRFARELEHDPTASMLVVCLDCAEFTTYLRCMVWAQRGKTQVAPEAQQATWEGVNRDTELKQPFLAMMLSKHGFVPRVLREVRLEMEAREEAAPQVVVGEGEGEPADGVAAAAGWDARTLLPKDTTLVIVGASDEVLVLAHGALRLTSAGDEITPERLRNTLAGDADVGAPPLAALQGEGEAMMFLVVLLLIGLVHEMHGAAHVRLLAFNLVVDDADGLCGRSMSFVHSLMQWAAAQGVQNMFNTCRVVLSLSRRKENKLRGVGAIMQRRERSVCIAASRDELWHVMFNLPCLVRLTPAVSSCQDSCHCTGWIPNQDGAPDLL